MADYKQLYYMLFNKLTDLSEEIKRIQQDAEERFLQMDEEENTQ